MREVMNMKWFVVAVATLILRELLSPVIAPVFGPALPTVGGFIQSTMTRTNQALVRTAIRNTAAGYREPADVLLSLVSCLVLLGVAIGAAAAFSRVPPIESPRKRYAFAALVVILALGLGAGVLMYVTELSARNAAMEMYKLYERKMAVLAPYISPQEARELGAQWARMDTVTDVQAMDERFLALMRQHGLTSQ